MLSDSWVMPQILGQFITLILISYAAILAYQVHRHWDIQSSSDLQLSLEHKSYLVSSLLKYIFSFQALLLLLLVLFANNVLPTVIRGAMCATGSFNANSFGFPALLIKLGGGFLYGYWLLINYIDNKVPGYYLTRIKYSLILWIIAPYVYLDTTVLVLYFSKLDPTIVTSCCSIVFADTGKGLSNVMITALSERIVLWCFYILLVITLATQLTIFFLKGGRMISLLVAFSAFFSTLLLFISFEAQLVHLCKYIYAMPSHHCPFDMLWSRYYFIGYPIWLSLFMGAFFGIASFILELIKKIESLKEESFRFQRRCIVFSFLGFSFFTLLSYTPKLIWDFFGGQMVR